MSDACVVRPQTMTHVSSTYRMKAEDKWAEEPLTHLDTETTLSRTSPNFTAARRYSVGYADADDDTVLALVDPDCDFGTLWGVMHGTVGVRVALAEERRYGIHFIGPTGLGQATSVGADKASFSRGSDARSSSQAFAQVTDRLFERNGWARRPADGLFGVLRKAQFVKLRETIVVRDGRIISRVLQQVSKTPAYRLQA